MEAEACLPLHYRQKAMRENEHIAKLNFLTLTYMDQYEKFKARYSDDDIRPLAFRKIASILSYYKLSLCYTFGILSRLDNMNVVLDRPQPVKRTEAAAVLKEYEQYITFSFFHVVFSSVEGSMRSLVGQAEIVDRKGKRCRSTSKFSDIYMGLIDFSGVGGEYPALFELLSLMRNCIHNRGIFISDKGPQSVVYQKVKYDFIQEQPILFADFELILNVLFDIRLFLTEVFDSPNMLREQYLKDNLA